MVWQDKQKKDLCNYNVQDKVRTERQLRFNVSNFFPGLVSLLAFAWLFVFTFVFTLVVAAMFFFCQQTPLWGSPLVESPQVVPLPPFYPGKLVQYPF